MTDQPPSGCDSQALSELERRHDELLAQLEELDRRIVQVLQAVHVEQLVGSPPEPLH